MVFEATSFWALILLVAGVGLLGVATILIKRRKDSRF
jgi:LPXTG-motif cell wall-anchored protein